MREIVVTNTKEEAILERLNICLKGNLKEQWGEHVLEFNNDIGKGTIRSISFDWGVSLLDYTLYFNEEVQIIFKSSSISPIEFVFISQGSFKYKEGDMEDHVALDQYQNIIIAPKRYSKKSFVFPPNSEIKVNFIRIIRKEYLKKQNNNVTYLNHRLLSLFENEGSSFPYMHKGNYSLKIADEIKALHNSFESGVIRTLSLEGRLYLILAMQLMEHHNFETGNTLPESLSKEDIKRIHRLSDFIVDRIANPISVRILSQESGLSPKKLQLGFQVLYSKSVNEYVRQLKLEISRDYLSNTDLSVSEIVYAVGIKSRSYFSKIFSEAYGVLPTEYKKRLRQGKS